MNREGRVVLMVDGIIRFLGCKVLVVLSGTVEFLSFGSCDCFFGCMLDLSNLLDCFELELALEFSSRTLCSHCLMQ